MDLSLAGRVALVTGGGSGIGEAACLALAEAGAGVAVVDIRPDPARIVADRITQNGGRAIALTADVGDEEAVSAAVTQRRRRAWRAATSSSPTPASTACRPRSTR